MKKQAKTKKVGSSRKAQKTRATAPAARTKERDARLPAVGTTIKREYKGMSFRVHVQDGSFRCNGEDWRSLSALASKITGNPTNGFLFFKLIARPATPKVAKRREKVAAGIPTTAHESVPAQESATA